MRDDSDRVTADDIWTLVEAVCTIIAAVLLLPLYALGAALVIGLIIALPVGLSVIIGAVIIAGAVIGRR